MQYVNNIGDRVKPSCCRNINKIIKFEHESKFAYINWKYKFTVAVFRKIENYKKNIDEKVWYWR